MFPCIEEILTLLKRSIVFYYFNDIIEILMCSVKLGGGEIMCSKLKQITEKTIIVYLIYFTNIRLNEGLATFRIPA